MALPHLGMSPRKGHKPICTTCKLCSYEYKSPKLLPCYHTFCEACLYGVVSQMTGTKAKSGEKIYACPVCAAEFTLPKGGVHTLPTNYVLAAHLLRLRQKNRVANCDACTGMRHKEGKEPVVAKIKCWECDKFLCNRCQDIHHQLLRYHTLIHYTQAGPSKVVHNQYCGRHPDQLLLFYCMKCEEIICRDCKVTAHMDGHHTMDLADLQTRAKDLVTKVNDILIENFLPVMESTTKFLAKEYSNISKSKANIVGIIRSREKILIQVVQTATKSCMEMLDQTVQGMQSEALLYRNTMDRLRSEVEYNALVLKSGGQADVLSAAGCVMQYGSTRTSHTSLIKVLRQSHELMWKNKPTHSLLSKEALFNKRVSHFTVPDFHAFAECFLGYVTLEKTGLTLSPNEARMDSLLKQSFRKIALLVDEYKRIYRPFSSNG